MLRFFSRLSVFAVLCSLAMPSAGGSVAVKLLGAIWPFEFMTLAGNGEQGHGHKKDGETFHRAAS